MKKVLSFVLVLSMILGSFGMAFAGNAQSDALSVLSGLGVFAGYTDGSMGEDKVVTRAEAATLIIKAMDLQDYAVGKTTFTDMDQAKWAEPFVAYAVSLGFVKGNTDGTFAPNATVTSDQMITMLVQAIGYKAEYLTGGYPGAFVNTAKALGILEGVKSGAEGCTRGDVAQMIYNALEVPFVSYDAEGGLQYTVLRGTANDGDVVYDNFMERLIDELGKETKVIEGDEESKINLKSYQGAYATLIKDGDDVVAVDDVKSVFITGDFVEDDDVITFETADAEYKLGKVVVFEDYLYFENGAVADTQKTYAALKNAKTEDVTLAVEISGKYITDVYSAAVWTEGTTVMWTEDLAEDLAEDCVIGNDKFAQDDNDEIKADEFVLLGVASLDDIEEEDVVTYYVGKVDGEAAIVKVEVSKETVEGKITKKNQDGKFIIDGKAYAVADKLIKNVDGEDSAEIKLSLEGTFYLNYAGEIVCAVGTSTSADDYAIVTVDSQTKGDEFEGTTMKIKMLTEDGKEAIYVIEEEYADGLDEREIKAGTLIAYNLDKNGEIDKIEKVTTEAAVGKVTAKGFLDGYKIADDVIVFEYDAEDEEYSVATLADVPVGEALGANTAYVADKENDVIEIIILDATAGDDDEPVYGVLFGWNEGLNDDDKVVYELDMLVDGEEENFKSTTSFELKKGTVLYEVKFDGSDVKEFADVVAVEGKIEIIENATVAGIKNGNIKVDAEGYREVAADVVVYKVEDDKIVDKAASVADIDEEDNVILYDLDVDEEDGIDVIIFW